MRTAVLVSNYFVAGLIVLGLLGSLESSNTVAVLTGFILISPAVILSIVYAHKTGDKDGRN